MFFPPNFSARGGGGSPTTSVDFPGQRFRGGPFARVIGAGLGAPGPATFSKKNGRGTRGGKPGGGG